LFLYLDRKVLYWLEDPVTENYARIELLKHRPWKTTLSQPTTENIIQQFKTFLNDPKCPRTVKLSYERAKLKFH